MDLSELLGVTEPVSVMFMEHEFTAHVYTAGAQKLTIEERETVLPKETDGLASETDNTETYSSQLRYIRRVLPVIARAVDMDGSPVLYKEIPFPQNINSFPNNLLVELGSAALDKWNAKNPTSGVAIVSGSQPEEQLEQSQTVSSTP